MKPIQVRAAQCFILAVTAVTLSECSSAAAPGLTTPACPGYTITAQDITVAPNGGTFALSPTNATRLVFDPGAVKASSSYHVEALVFQGKQVAGIRITPNGGAGTTFSANVTLRLGYADCPFANASNKFVIARVENGAPRSIGGTESSSGMYVDATLDHFSDYMIAD